LTLVSPPCPYSTALFNLPTSSSVSISTPVDAAPPHRDDFRFKTILPHHDPTRHSGRANNALEKLKRSTNMPHIFICAAVRISTQNWTENRDNKSALNRALICAKSPRPIRASTRKTWKAFLLPRHPRTRNTAPKCMYSMQCANFRTSLFATPADPRGTLRRRELRGA
jgi:hypothetical protein